MSSNGGARYCKNTGLMGGRDNYGWKLCTDKSFPFISYLIFILCSFLRDDVWCCLERFEIKGSFPPQWLQHCVHYFLANQRMPFSFRLKFLFTSSTIYTYAIFFNCNTNFTISLSFHFRFQLNLPELTLAYWNCKGEHGTAVDDRILLVKKDDYI